MPSAELISPAYKSEQEALHAKGNYGTASLGFGDIVTRLLNKTQARTILDYGCGSMQNLTKVLRPDHDVDYLGYDPAVDRFAENNVPCDLVVCIDVLEHIEPDLLDNVLDDLQRCTSHFAFFTVHTGPAVKTLSDGRNAHLIQEPPTWWLSHILARWSLVQFQLTPNGFYVVLKNGDH